VNIKYALRACGPAITFSIKKQIPTELMGVLSRDWQLFERVAICKEASQRAASSVTI